MHPSAPRVRSGIGSPHRVNTLHFSPNNWLNKPKSIFPKHAPHKQSTNYFKIPWHAFCERRIPRPWGPVPGVLTVSKILSLHLWAPHSNHIANALTYGTSPYEGTTECELLTRFLWEKDSSVPRASTREVHGVNDSITLPVGTPIWSHCKLPDARNLTFYRDSIDIFLTRQMQISHPSVPRG
jgi:hypothetical protein